MDAMQIAGAAKPQFVISPDGIQLATYERGDQDAPTVVVVHGFASSAIANWQITGWVRDLTSAGFRVVGLDQRGHGASSKPHDPRLYSMDLLIGDLLAVMDTYMINDADLVGYSLGARVGWQAALELPERINRAVLGGIPDGDPLMRFSVEQAKAYIRDGSEIDDRLTWTYLSMAAGIPNNDLSALVALVEGMRGGVQPDPANPPGQPLLFATGSEDRIVEASRSLAAAAPRGSFFEIPGRTHFSAPTSRAFRDAAVEFLR
jgi:pimeloyl-ACP methyl ester carboxylesterase